MWEMRVRYLGWENPLEKEIATRSSILAWKIPWTEKPGGLQSMGSQRVGYDWATRQSHTYSYLLASLGWPIFIHLFTLHLFKLCWLRVRYFSVNSMFAINTNQWRAWEFCVLTTLSSTAPATSKPQHHLPWVLCDLMTTYLSSDLCRSLQESLYSQIAWPLPWFSWDWVVFQDAVQPR